MSLLPIPAAPEDPTSEFIGRELADWAARLVAYLKGQTAPESTLEEVLALGGADMASKIFGLEGKMVAPLALDTAEVLAAPTGAKKKTVTSITVSTPGTAVTFRLYKLKGATQTDIATDQVSNANPFTDLATCRITLDAADDSLRIEATTGTQDLHWDGSYLDLD